MSKSTISRVLWVVMPPVALLALIVGGFCWMYGVVVALRAIATIIAAAAGAIGLVVLVGLWCDKLEKMGVIK